MRRVARFRGPCDALSEAQVELRRRRRRRAQEAVGEIERGLETYQQLGGIIESRIWIDSDGYVSPSNEPGLGVVINEEMIKRYAV